MAISGRLVFEAFEILNFCFCKLLLVFLFVAVSGKFFLIEVLALLLITCSSFNCNTFKLKTIRTANFLLVSVNYTRKRMRSIQSNCLSE